ncbi:MAG: LPS assembly lipoprotein LptE [Zavarzinella sp.]
MSSLHNRRTFLGTTLGFATTLVCGCASDGQWSLLGYSTRPNFDPSIQSVYIPVFKNRAFVTGPYRDLEMHLTRFVGDEIEKKTPMKVISDPDRADTELQGTIALLQKQILNVTPFNEAREVQLVVSVEIVWHDLRPGREGQILTNPKTKEDTTMGNVVFDPNHPPKERLPDVPIPVVITDTGRILPEVGETTATGVDMVLKRLAKKIVNAMEESW